MKAYLTWGVGYSKSKVLAIENAKSAAGISKIKVSKLPNLEMPKCEVSESKRELSKLKGEHSGIVLQNCAKGEVAASLVLGVTEKKIAIGHGKAGGPIKAERLAVAEMESSMKGQNLKSEGINYHIAADIKAPKDNYGCAIVALVLVK
jgi:pyruvoyl-dependent arginine decarboxylase (PvlArgDC)